MNNNNTKTAAQSQNKKTVKRNRRSKRQVNNASNAYLSKKNPVAPTVAKAPSLMSSVGPLRGKRFVDDRMARLSKDGLSFLKCAFAPPDFDNTRVMGVPDNFQGKSLIKRSRNTASITFNSGLDYYIILAPIPGCAYALATVPAGNAIAYNTIFTMYYYPDSHTLFFPNSGAPGNAADILSKFRFVSNHIEIVPTMNAMNWSGSIQSWKLPLAVEATGSPLTYCMNGLQSCNGSNCNQYTSSFNMGVYAGAYNVGPDFDFAPILDNTDSVPESTPGSPNGPWGQFQSGSGVFTGFDNNFESVLVKITGLTSNQTALIKIWSCVEYQVNTGAILYDYQTLSPRDDKALELYRAIVMELPVAVSCFDNDGFWRRVLDIIRSVSRGLSYIPGPYGLAAQGVNNVADAINTLTI